MPEVVVTFKNAAVEEALLDWFREHLSAPTIRQLQAKIGFKSPNTVAVHLRVLVQAGRVVQTGHGISRSYVPVSWLDRVKSGLKMMDTLSPLPQKPDKDKLTVLDVEHLF